MKIILLADVSGVGRKFDVKTVTDGYGRNFLLRSKLAEVATPLSLRKAEKMRKELEQKETLKNESLEKAVQAISGKKVKITAKANEEGHLFAGVHVADIVSAVSRDLGIVLDESCFVLPSNLKSIGIHSVAVHAGKTNAEVLVSIERE